MGSEMNIFEYNNYRKLLDDFYRMEKAKSPVRFSFRYVSKKAGFASSNFLYLIINGKRNISYDSIQRLARVMCLNKRETLFFENLVHFNQTKNPEEKTRAFKKMISFKEYRGSKKLSKEQYEYFSKWYCPVVREMVNMEGFKEDPAWIAKNLKPSITKVQAREALYLLENLGLVTRDSEGRLRQTDQNISTEDEVASAALMGFHKEMIQHGQDSLMRPADERDISALTMSLSDVQFSWLRRKIREFHKDIQKMLSDDSDSIAESVYQLNFQLFNLTNYKKGASHEAK